MVSLPATVPPLFSKPSSRTRTTTIPLDATSPQFVFLPPPATSPPKSAKLLKVIEAKEGPVAAEAKSQELVALEKKALRAIRAYAKRKLSLKKTMTDLIAYEDQFGDEKRYYPLFEETLRERPWESCPCSICKDIGVEVVILRGNNRNRRRGFHNTWTFYQQFKEKRDQLAKMAAGPSS